MNRVFLTGILFCFIQCGPTAPADLEPILKAHGAVYPEMEPADWYKLVHQGAMGNLHLGVAFHHLEAYLEEEWETIEGAIQMAPYEYISPDSQLVRFHLQRFKACGGNQEAILTAMQRTAESFSPSSERLESFLKQLGKFSEKHHPTSIHTALKAFIEEQKIAGYPAVHHSQRYLDTYQPAYRVLLQNTAPPCPTHQSS